MSSYKAFKRARDYEDEEHGDSDDDDDEGLGEEAEESEDDGEDGGGREAPKLTWEEANFVSKTRTSDGRDVYHTELLPELSFFSKEKLVEFTKGTRFKKLKQDMKRGLRTHDDVQKLQQKKAARKERQQQRKREKRSGKRAAKAQSLSQTEIDARKAKFAAKKARRLERKAAAS